MSWKENYEIKRGGGQIQRPSTLTIETLGEAMRPESLRGEAFRLSREERDHIAGHALDSMRDCASDLAKCIGNGDVLQPEASKNALRITALSSLLDEIGWEREYDALGTRLAVRVNSWHLSPVAEVGRWLEEWQRQDNEALIDIEETLDIAETHDPENDNDADYRQGIVDAQTKLGTGAILLARIEKWMASRGN
jgi:hypothetical protein